MLKVMRLILRVVCFVTVILKYDVLNVIAQYLNRWMNKLNINYSFAWIPIHHDSDFFFFLKHVANNLSHLEQFSIYMSDHISNKLKCTAVKDRKININSKVSTVINLFLQWKTIIRDY